MDNGWDEILAHVRLEADRSEIKYGEKNLLFLIGAAGPEHSERLRLPQASTDCAKYGGREPLSVDWSDVVLVYEAPRSLFRSPVVAA